MPNLTDDSNEINPTPESLLVEYSATQEAYLHYDNYSWQIAAVLIAGTFVFWGFLFDPTIVQPMLLVTGAILVTLFMSIWILFAHHMRQIYLSKLHRIYEIEKILGLKQHSRWIKKDPVKQSTYRVFGPRGHDLDSLIYVITSLGTPIIGLFKIGFNSYFLIPLVFVVCILAWNGRNERKIKNHLASLTIQGVDHQNTRNDNSFNEDSLPSSTLGEDLKAKEKQYRK